MAEEEKQKIQRGDIIHLDYDLWIADDDILFDTTHKEVADEHEISDENAVYQPRALIVDEGKAVSGLYKSLLSAEIGEEYEIEIPPEEGLGTRDPKLVEWHMTKEIERQKLEPVVGKDITVKDKSGREKTGIVTMVTPRRTRVDYNNPLAGKTLRYKYKVVDKAMDIEDKISTILEMDFGRKDDFDIKMDDEAVEIKLPDVCKYDQLWLIAKYKVVNDLREYAGLNKIRFIEEYVKKEETEEEGEAEGEVSEKEGGEKEVEGEVSDKEGEKKGEEKEQEGEVSEEEGGEEKEAGKVQEEKEGDEKKEEENAQNVEEEMKEG
ncbi:MAG: FKBP-type peptidyl-prolyl cis-trans isomerase [Methanomassiliicoccales archaeon]|nr:MAG: FKBP-type peptidyl-prolyl cis-trans isomerase [Methanomassiliicoccales archaeon]